MQIDAPKTGHVNALSLRTRESYQGLNSWPRRVNVITYNSLLRSSLPETLFYILQLHKEVGFVSDNIICDRVPFVFRLNGATFSARK